MRLEPTKFERLKAEVEGSEEYLEETRESAKRKMQELETYQVVHNNTEANQKQYLEQQIKFLAKEEERTIEKIEDLGERLLKEDEPKEKDEQIEISAHKAGKIGVTKDLASIGLSWNDVAEVCDDYDSLLGGGVPPAIYDKDSSKASKRGSQIKIEGRRRDVELEKQIERERIENDKRQEMEAEEEQKEVEEQSPKVDETIEQKEPAEVDSIEDEPTQIEEVSEDVQEIDNAEIPEINEEVPNIEEANCSEAESVEEVGEAVEEFMPEEIEDIGED